jgi:(p)ppGpp synthase/HD superfamily hydrolase
MLSAWEVPNSTRIAALMMPVVRYDFVSETEVTKAFGQRVMQLARFANNLILYDGTKEIRRRPPPAEVLHAQMLRRLFITAYADLDAVLICAAVRLAAVQQLDEIHNEIDRQTWAQKSMAVYVPLMEMLGLWLHRHDLSSSNLRVLQPTLYSEFEQYLIEYEEQNIRLFDRIEYELYGLLDESGIRETQVRLHQPTPGSLYRRMEEAERRGERFDPSDMRPTRIDVLVENERDCYVTLGIIHQRWKPAHRQGSFAEGRFLDFIAAPRYNGYRCLITTVLCEEPAAAPDEDNHYRLVEFRIRTREMEAINIYGIVAAMQYDNPLDDVWWEDQAVRQAITRNSGDLHGQPFCVFVPTGEVIYPLKPDSTLVDLAFRLYSATGPYARDFLVNGRKSNYDRKLKHCDLVSIQYDMQYPSIQPDWEEHARTTGVQRQIRRFLRQSERSPHKGRQLIDQILERENKIYRMRFPEEKVEKALNTLTKDFNCATLEALYIKVQENIISPDEVVAAMIEAELVEHIICTDGTPWPAANFKIAQTWMQEKGDRKWDRDVRVMPGADIAGRVVEEGDREIIVVHRADHPQAPAEANAVALHWRPQTTQRESVEVVITASPRESIAGRILKTVYDLGEDNIQQGVSLHRFQAEMKDGSAVIDMIIDAPSFDGIHDMQNALDKLRKDGIIADFNIWQLFPGQKMLLAGKLDKRQQNPYTLQQVRDRTMFFGRDAEITRVVETVSNARPLIVIYGQKRIGKTSLMHHLAEYVLPQACDVIPVMVTAHRLSPFTPATFLLSLVGAALTKVNRSEDRKGLKLKEQDFKTDPYGTFADWVGRVQQRLRGTRLLFMVDEFTRAEEECQRGRLDETFFDGMQSLVDNHDVGFLLCVHDNIYNDKNSHSFGLFQRGMPVPLQSLDPVAAARLVRQPMERIYRFDDEVVQYILRLTDCHPYFIHALCLEINTLMKDAPSNEVTQMHVDQAALKLMRTGNHYFNHFRSATDDFSWEVVKVLAYLADEDIPWVTRDELQAALQAQGVTDQKISERMRVSNALQLLKQSDIIDAQIEDGIVRYSIPVGLFHRWLRQLTNPLITRDIRQEN